MSRLTKYEMETVINYNLRDKTAKIYTAIPREIARLDALCEKYPKHYKCIAQDSVSKTYECASKKLIKINKPVILTEEQKAVLRERFQQIRK